MQLLRAPRRVHTVKESKAASLGVLLFLVLAYWFTGWPLVRLLSDSPELNFYLVQPIIWTVLALGALHAWQRLGDSPPFRRSLTALALAMGTFHVALLGIAGLVLGDFTTTVGTGVADFLGEALYVITLLLGVETARAFLYWAWRDRNAHLAFAITTLVFFVVAVPPVQWGLVDNLDALLDIVLGGWIPILAVSTLATWLVDYGGLGPSIGYRFPLLALVWLSPVVPDLEWAVLLLIGLLVPPLSIGLIRSIYRSTDEGRPRHRDSGEDSEAAETRGPWSVIAYATLAVLIAGTLIAGFLGFRPFVVSGISMMPSMDEGDIAVVDENVDPSELAVEDIVKFRLGGLHVVHRIISVEESADGLVFLTQGDNVNRPDQPVVSDQIDGKVVFVIPELGHVALWLHGA